MEGNEHIVFKTNQHLKLENGIVLEVVRTYPTWRMRIQVFLQMSSQAFNDRNQKCQGKGRKWGQHIICTKYETICTHNIKSCKSRTFQYVVKFTLKSVMHIQETIQINKTYSLSQRHKYKMTNNISILKSMNISTYFHI